MAKKVAAKKKSNAKKKPTKKPMAAAPVVSAPMTAAPVPAAPPAPVAPMPFVVVPSPDAALTPPKSTVTNVIDDPSVSLQRFDLLDLQPYTQEKVYSTTASRDFHLFYVGRDNVHDILKHVLSRVSISLYLNMFGFDDDELNDILMKIALDDTVMMMVTLDKSQAGGKHEKALLDADDSTILHCSTPTLSPKRTCRSLSSASRQPIRSATPRGSWPTAESLEKDRPIGQPPARAPL
jgi:hypothetical protein